MTVFARLLILVVLVLISGLPARAAEDNGLVIIANPQSDLVRLTRSEVINLYMGRINRLPSGVSALPLDLVDAREEFYQGLVNKRLAEINSYWARLMFSGRASPPRQVASSAEMLEIVASNRGAIGYVRQTEVDERVLVLMDMSHLVSEL